MENKIISWTLLKYDAKRCWLLFVIILAILLLYMNIIVGMYDPSGMEAMQEVANMKGGKDMMKAFGFDLSKNLVPSLTQYLSQYFYGFLIFIFPLIYIIAVANRLIAKMVDNGSMVYLLTTPQSRLKIATTQALFLFLSTSFLLLMLTLSAIMVSEQLFPNMIDKTAFVNLNFGALAVSVAFTGIAYCCSASFSESSRSIALSTAIPVVAILLHVFSNLGGSLEVLKYFTFITLFDAQGIVAGCDFGLQLSALFAVGAIGYAFGIYIFTKRDMSL